MFNHQRFSFRVNQVHPEMQVSLVDAVNQAHLVCFIFSTSKTDALKYCFILSGFPGPAGRKGDNGDAGLSFIGCSVYIEYHSLSWIGADGAPGLPGFPGPKGETVRAEVRKSMSAILKRNGFLRLRLLGYGYTRPKRCTRWRRLTR